MTSRYSWSLKHHFLRLGALQMQGMEITGNKKMQRKCLILQGTENAMNGKCNESFAQLQGLENARNGKCKE